MSTLFPIIKTVITDPKVIITTILILLYFEIVTVIVHYRKKPPVKRRKPSYIPPADAGEKKDESNAEGENSAEEDS